MRGCTGRGAVRCPAGASSHPDSARQGDTVTSKDLSPPQAARTLAARNRRTAFGLVGWIALLAAASMAVAWFRN